MTRMDSGLGRRRAKPAAVAVEPVGLDVLVADSTVDELLGQLEAGKIDLVDLLAAERRGRNRKGVLALDPNA